LIPISLEEDFQIVIEGRRRFPPTYNISRLANGEWERVLVVQTTRRGNFSDAIFLTHGSPNRDDWEQVQAESFLDLLEPGEYILEVSVSWGSNRSGFEGQHFFRLAKYCEEGDIISNAQGTLEERAVGRESYFPYIVNELPAGFIALDLVLEGNSEILRPLFWSTNIVFQDAKNITIFQANVRNNEFIVIYNNSYYVNEKMISEILETATVSWERLNKIYSIGDTIKMNGLRHGNAVVFAVTISSVEKNIVGETSVYSITINIDQSFSQSQFLQFFHSVETGCGSSFSNFTILNDNNSTAHSKYDAVINIELDNSKVIDEILLHVPRGFRVSVFQTNTYSVRNQSDAGGTILPP